MRHLLATLCRVLLTLPLLLIALLWLLSFGDGVWFHAGSGRRYVQAHAYIHCVVVYGFSNLPFDVHCPPRFLSTSRGELGKTPIQVMAGWPNEHIFYAATGHLRARQWGESGNGTLTGQYFRVPMWSAMLLALPLAIGAWIGPIRRRILHRRRHRHGLCTACGYDLRESIERCPECGEPISSVAA